MYKALKKKQKLAESELTSLDLLLRSLSRDIFNPVPLKDFRAFSFKLKKKKKNYTVGIKVPTDFTIDLEITSLPRGSFDES